MSISDRIAGAFGFQRKPAVETKTTKTRTRASYGSYAGAERNRLLADWVWRYVSADQEVWRDLLILRGRARELVRNTSWGKNFVRLVRNNVIGHAGIRLQGRITKGNGEQNNTVNDELEATWGRWGEHGVCTTDGRQSWISLQQLLGTNLPMDGEFLCRLIRGFDNPFGFAVQLLDPDQLDHMYSAPASKTGNEIRQGIEIDEWSRPVAYWLWRGHPTDVNAPRDRVRVPAEDIIHIVDPYRVNQTRGITWLAPSMADINMLRGYYEAELVAARVAAAKGGFFVRTAEDDDPGPATEGVPASRLTMDAEPGVFDELPAGLDFKEFKPEHPTTAFPDFSRALLRSISAGIGVSATALTNDLSDVNYSSIRAGLLHERDEHRRVQTLVIQQFHTRIYREWVKMARLSGALDLRLSLEQFYNVEWQARGWSWVDPKGDIEAAILAIDHGLDSRRRILGEDGIDYADVIRDLAAEQQEADREDVEIHGALPAPAPAASPPPDAFAISPRRLKALHG